MSYVITNFMHTVNNDNSATKPTPEAEWNYTVEWVKEMDLCVCLCSDCFHHGYENHVYITICTLQTKRYKYYVWVRVTRINPPRVHSAWLGYHGTKTEAPSSE